MDARVLPGLEPLLTPIGDLEPHPQDPYLGDAHTTAAWLARTGQHRPITATRDGLIVKGADVWRAARALGWTHVAATRDLDLDAGQALAVVITDHRTADLGGYDETDLAALLAPLDYGLAAAAGYTPDALDALLAAAPAAAARAELPEPAASTESPETGGVGDSGDRGPSGTAPDSPPPPASDDSPPAPARTRAEPLTETVLVYPMDDLAAVTADIATLTDKWGPIPTGPLVLRVLRVAAAPYLDPS